MRTREGGLYGSPSGVEGKNSEKPGTVSVGGKERVNKVVVDLLSDDGVLEDCGGKEKADAQKRVHHLIDLENAGSFEEH